MISGRFSQFYIDVGNIGKDKLARLDLIGIYEDLGLGLRRYWFNWNRMETVEEILDDRVVIDVKHQKSYIADVSFRDEALGKISITMGSEAVKMNETMVWKSVVAEVLQDDIKARNSDVWLFIKVLQKIGYAVYGDYEAVDSMPKPETLSRIRRKYQEQGLYPADPDVAYTRREYEQEMKDINKWYPKGSKSDEGQKEEDWEEDPDKAINQGG